MGIRTLAMRLCCAPLRSVPCDRPMYKKPGLSVRSTKNNVHRSAWMSSAVAFSNFEMALGRSLCCDSSRKSEVKASIFGAVGLVRAAIANAESNASCGPRQRATTAECRPACCFEVTRPFLQFLQNVTVATALDGTNGEDCGNAGAE